MRLALLPTIFLAATIVGCNADTSSTPARTADVQSLEVLSIDPVRPESQPPEHFHGWRVLGRTFVSEADSRDRILNAIAQGIKEGEAKGMAAGCFNPRHGVAIVAEDGSTRAYVICFECLQVQRYTNGERVKGSLISSTPKPLLDSILKGAGIQLADPAP